MSNKLSAVLILCISTVSLSACDLIRVAGPCYGVGCPTGTEGRNGQYKQGQGPKAQNASAPAPAKPAAPAQSASTSAQPTTAQATNAQAATAQPAPAQPASTESKSSPFHAIGEFFERLIPHHNSGANSGASN